MNSKSSKNTNTCTIHRREYEGYCLACRVLVCASCTLNNEHTSHTFMSIPETTKYLRGIIDENIKKNLIKQQHTEEKLVRLKQTRLQIESNSLQMMNNIEEVINEIIDHLKMRKNKISEIIQEMTERETSLIKRFEENWKDKEKIVKTLIQLGNNPDDKLLIENSTYIVNGIDILKQKIEDYRVSVVNDFDFNLKINTIKEITNSSQHKTDEMGSLQSNTIGNMNKYQLQNSRFFQKMINSNKLTKKTEIEKVNVTLEQLLDSIMEMFSFREPNIIELKA